MYPPDLSKPENVQPFLQAMGIAGIPRKTAGTVLTVFERTEGTVAKKLTAVRDYFDMSKEGSLRLFNGTCSKTLRHSRFATEISQRNQLS